MQTGKEGEGELQAMIVGVYFMYLMKILAPSTSHADLGTWTHPARATHLARRLPRREGFQRLPRAHPDLQQMQPCDKGKRQCGCGCGCNAVSQCCLTVAVVLSQFLPPVRDG